MAAILFITTGTRWFEKIPILFVPWVREKYVHPIRRLLLLLLVWIFSLHLSGVYIFMSGFLLSRSALPDVSSCTESVSLFFLQWKEKAHMKGGSMVLPL